MRVHLTLPCMVNRTRFEINATGAKGQSGRWPHSSTASWRGGSYWRWGSDAVRSTPACASATCGCSTAAFTRLDMARSTFVPGGWRRYSAVATGLCSVIAVPRACGALRADTAAPLT